LIDKHDIPLNLTHIQQQHRRFIVSSEKLCVSGSKIPATLPVTAGQSDLGLGLVRQIRITCPRVELRGIGDKFIRGVALYFLISAAQEFAIPFPLMDSTGLDQADRNVNHRCSRGPSLTGGDVG
jgi:hypothetical protein